MAANRCTVSITTERRALGSAKPWNSGSSTRGMPTRRHSARTSAATRSWAALWGRSGRYSTSSLAAAAPEAAAAATDQPSRIRVGAASGSAA